MTLLLTVNWLLKSLKLSSLIPYATSNGWRGKKCERNVVALWKTGGAGVWRLRVETIKGVEWVLREKGKVEKTISTNRRGVFFF